jgi:hypothetical protein
LDRDRSVPSIDGGRQIPFLLTSVRADLEKAWELGQPVERDGCHKLPSDGDLRYRSVVLPCVIEQTVRRHVLGATTYRVAAPQRSPNLV